MKNAKWPFIKFNAVRLFDLRISDLVCHDPYFVRMSLDDAWRDMGDEFFIALLDAPEVVACFCEVCPDYAKWIKDGIAKVSPQKPSQIREAEAKLLKNDWNLGMAKSPEIWDALPWSYWNPAAIYKHIDLRDKVILDIGAGTGQVSLRCAPFAKKVFALEPVARLRKYIERKMSTYGLLNVQTLDGVLAKIPLKNNEIDACILSNGSFGWQPRKELREMERVTKSGGIILMLGPCNFNNDKILDPIHKAGYKAFDFEVPCNGMKPGFVKSIRKSEESIKKGKYSVYRSAEELRKDIEE
jgi:SAM-dependent methyltransferase